MLPYPFGVFPTELVLRECPNCHSYNTSPLYGRPDGHRFCLDCGAHMLDKDSEAARLQAEIGEDEYYERYCQ